MPPVREGGPEPHVEVQRQDKLVTAPDRVPPMIRLCDGEAQLTELAGCRHASMELVVGQRPESRMLIAMRRAENGFGVVLLALIPQHPPPGCSEAVLLEKPRLANRPELFDDLP